jgi:hypothetical protein
MTRPCRAAVGYALSGVGGFIVLSVASGFFPAAAMPAFVGAGFVVFVGCGARAMTLCGADEVVFDTAKRAGRYSEAPAGATDASYSVLSAFIQSRLRPRSSQDLNR